MPCNPLLNVNAQLVIINCVYIPYANGVPKSELWNGCLLWDKKEVLCKKNRRSVQKKQANAKKICTSHWLNPQLAKAVLQALSADLQILGCMGNIAVVLLNDFLNIVRFELLHFLFQRRDFVRYG